MNKVVVIKKEDGGCSILNPAPEMFDVNSRTRQLLTSTGVLVDEENKPISDESIIFDWIVEKDVPSYRSLMLSGESDEEAQIRLNIQNLDSKLPHRITNTDNLPVDRYFRNAWTDDNPTETVDVHVEKAQAIQKNKLRQLREPLLAKLDVEYQRADEAGDTTKKQEIAKLKQELRDVPDLEFPNELEELKNFVPDVLLNLSSPVTEASSTVSTWQQLLTKIRNIFS